MAEHLEGIVGMAVHAELARDPSKDAPVGVDDKRGAFRRPPEELVVHAL